MPENGSTDARPPIGPVGISVVLACYTEERLDSIRAALTSLRRQVLAPRGVIVAVDNCESLACRLAREFTDITVVLNRGDRGASATRNRGVEMVDTEFTAFLDDDETADPGWLLELTRPFADPQVVGTGGRCIPAWPSAKPDWFPDEFTWVVGGAYQGLPTVTSRVRNVWSGNMAVRTAKFRQVGGFRTDFGKRGSVPQPEDTELCIRMAAATGGQWMYVPSAVITHEVPPVRTSVSFLVARCFAEGMGKASMSDKIQLRSSIDTERDYVRNTTRAALRRFLSARWMSSLQGAVMLIGLASAAVGYAAARLRRGPKPAPDNDRNHGDGRKPALVADFETTGSVDSFLEQLPSLTDYRYAWVLLRNSGRPSGVVEANACERELRERLSRVTEHGHNSNGRNGVAAAAPAADRVAGVGVLPGATVAICTRERPDGLARVLASLRRQTHRDFRLLVVDNAPTSTATRDIAAEFRSEFPSFDYVVEPTPGLSRARNRALRHVSTEVVAWIDDDEIADENWLAELLEEFRSHPGAAAVSGAVVPAELQTWPQWWFEKYGGHSKGRGFHKQVFTHGCAGHQSPLYPLPPFGAGANMAFRTESLRGLGGFDHGLGAGTPSLGGEDTLVFSQLLLDGHTVIYQPAAVTRHFHRSTLSALEQQMVGYGVSLTAFYVALLRWDWRLMGPMIRLLPTALADMFGRTGSVQTGLPDDFPTHLLRVKRLRMLLGPVAYLRARRSSALSGPA